MANEQKEFRVEVGKLVSIGKANPSEMKELGLVEVLKEIRCRINRINLKVEE